MDFELSEEQRMVQQTARSFARDVLARHAGERDEEERFPFEEVKQMGEMGFMGITVPEQYGGAGMDTISYVLMIEELAREDAAASVVVSVNNSLVCETLLRFGNEDQKQRYLVPLASGEKLGAFALSEAGAGSDPASLVCSARKEGKYYVINGTKNFITNGSTADVVIVFATVDKTLGHKGICAFVVERGTHGFQVSKKERKMGIRSSDTCELTFENCGIPVANLLAGEGEGLHVALTVLDSGRIGIAAQALGISQASLDVALQYARERKQFDRPLSSFQAIQFKFAELATEIEAARLLTFRAAALKDAGKHFAKEAAMAKLKASRIAVHASDEAVQILGGAGYLKDFPVERFFRDAKITELYEGTSEIQKLVISRHLLEK